MGNYDYGQSQRAERLKEIWRALDDAKKSGEWKNLVPTRCPRCGSIGQWPEQWSLPTCGLCYLRLDESVRVRWVKAATEPDDLDPIEPPELPPGLRPFETQVVRGIRRAAAKAAKDERHLIARWLRRQAASEDIPDVEALAKTVQSGQYLLEMQD